MVPPEWLPTKRAGPAAGTFSMPRTSERKYADSSGLSRGSVLAMCSGSQASKLSSPVASPAVSPSTAPAIWSSPSTGAGERRARWTRGLRVGAMTCASPTPGPRKRFRGKPSLTLGADSASFGPGQGTDAGSGARGHEAVAERGPRLLVALHSCQLDLLVAADVQRKRRIARCVLDVASPAAADQLAGVGLVLAREPPLRPAHRCVAEDIEWRAAHAAHAAQQDEGRLRDTGRQRELAVETE